MTLSGHKNTHTPKGVGAIYVGENVKILNMIKGENSEMA